MSIPGNKWFKCGSFCPTSAILPIYIKNPSLFSGTTNNPGSLATDVMRYANRVNTSILGQKRKTLILPVTQRVVPPLRNRIGNNNNF
jgi:hypothetical protein